MFGGRKLISLLANRNRGGRCSVYFWGDATKNNKINRLKNIYVRGHPKRYLILLSMNIRIIQ